MDDARFDRLTRSISAMLSRRALIGALGLGSWAMPGLAEAKKKHKKRKHKKKKKAKFNDFGCVNVGGFCKNNGQCCSGICQGKKDKKKCQAHDDGGCQPGQDFCLEAVAPCTTGTDDQGACVRTTGEAGYCWGFSGECFQCRKDADCVEFCGAQAACIDCATCGQPGSQTACVGPAPDSCTFPPP